eukprot:589167-Amphidinium_carterae.1
MLPGQTLRKQHHIDAKTDAKAARAVPSQPTAVDTLEHTGSKQAKNSAWACPEHNSATKLHHSFP